MLSASRYLLGVAEIGLLAGFAILGASQLRRRLLPDFSGAPAHLATAVLALALLIWVAELLGTFSLFEAVPYLLGVVLAGVAIWTLIRGWRGGRGGRGRPRPQRPPSPHDRTRGRSVDVATFIAFAIAAAAVIHFAAGVRLRLSTGMTGFDSTWYHGPFAAGFFQSGDTWSLHYIAPQFLAWFYPANAEIFHTIGMLAFHRDILSPLLNLGWFVGCLLAVWCIGRPFGVAPASLTLGSIALSVPALADQAGEARNDLVAIFFLLAAVAIAVNASVVRGGTLPINGSSVRSFARIPGESANAPPGPTAGALAIVGLAAGLSAGTKLNFLLPAAVLVVGLAVIAPGGERWRALGVSGFGALAAGGYWYLRNLAHSGSPLPWLRHLGPISLPGPAQALGGRKPHSVLGYLTDGSVWSHWFLPGLRDGLSVLWPLLVALALAGLLLCLGRRASPLLRVLTAVGFAAAFAWLVAPTAAEGPLGAPRGFESGLRYLAPALVLGLALLPTAPLLREKLAACISTRTHFFPHTGEKCVRTPGQRALSRPLTLVAAFALVLTVAVGYPVQRHYLRNRYAHPDFTTQGLDAAFKWARSISDASIATTATRQYPLFGTDLSNHVQFVGLQRPHGGFVSPTTCRAWRLALDAGHYDYAVVTRDRIESGKPAYPPQAAWTEGPGATVLLRTPPTVVFHLTAPLDPSGCGR